VGWRILPSGQWGGEAEALCCWLKFK
jgi:hypothetical protein